MPLPPAPVLYVEDEENDVLLMQLAFRRAGIAHPLEVALDGRTALEYLFKVSTPATRRIPCLVLLDLNLPRVSGLEVLHQVRRAPEFKELPIVIFSSSAQPSDKERATQLGATEYFVKPSQMDDIVAIAKELDRRWLAPARAEALRASDPPRTKSTW